MSGRAKLGLASLALGLALLRGAFGLWQHNRDEDREAGEQARTVLEDLAPEISRRAESGAYVLPAQMETAEEPIDTTMDTVEINGRRYIGFLSIPDLELELPVLEEWDYDRLNVAPCRYSGTLLGQDLVIAAHNYSYHFGHLKDLRLGAEILFTDVNGVCRRYRVEDLEVLEPGDVKSMTAGDYDLSLFTCTYGGAARFTVRCSYIPEQKGKTP